MLFGMENKINQERVVTINGVFFEVTQLLKIFPDSYFTTMLKSQYRESNQMHISIKFPLDVDPFSFHAKRYMEQIAYRILTGKYQYPKSDQKTNRAIIPKAEGNRFISFSEMKKVFSFLMINENELALVEDEPPDEITISDNDENEFDPYDLTEADHDNLDEKLLPDDDDDLDYDNPDEYDLGFDDYDDRW